MEIFPYQERADVMFNTSLHYELPVLKTIAYEMLLAIPQSAPEYLAAHRLLKNLNYFLPVDGEANGRNPAVEHPPGVCGRMFVLRHSLTEKQRI